MKGIAAGVGGGVAFAIFYIALSSSLVLAIVVALVAYLGISILFGSDKVKETSFVMLEGITNDVYKKTMSESEEKLGVIENLIPKTKDASMKTKVTEICEIAREILAQVQKDPKKIKDIRRFFSYYLDTAIEILEVYSEISNAKIKTEEIKAKMEKADSVLELIRETFEQQLKKAMKNDFMDLDVKIETLKEIRQMEE